MQEKKEVHFGTVAPVFYPVKTIPAIAIPKVISSDSIFSQVLNLVQHSEHVWSGVNPVTTDVQQISKIVTQYTIVMEKGSTKKQFVVIYNYETQVSEIVTSEIIKPLVKPVFVKETVSNGVVVVESNSVTEISEKHTEVEKVLEYSNQWLHVPTDWNDIKNIQVVPSTIEGGNVVYNIQTQSQMSSQNIQVSYNQQTEEMTVVNLEVQTMEPVVFAPEGPIIEVNVEENKQEINHYVESIKQAETTKEVKIKKVVKVEKEVNAFYEKVFTEFIDENDKTQVVTMIIQPG